MKCEPPDVSRARSGERGVALLVVLWILGTAALIVASMQAAAHSSLSFVMSEVQLAKAEALLDSGMEIAAARLIDKDQRRAWKPNGTRHALAFSGAELVISIRDANGLVDLNRADGDVLLGLFQRFATSREEAIGLRDAVLRARGETAENGKTDDKKHAGEMPFLNPTQFLFLDGATRRLYAQIAPYITVFGHDGLINAANAPDEVLMSIPGMTTNGINELRNTHDASGYTVSDALQSATNYTSDKAGPAFIVTVEVKMPGGTYSMREEFTIATGLDTDAPYRLISKSPPDSLSSFGP